MIYITFGIINYLPLIIVKISILVCSMYDFITQINLPLQTPNQKTKYWIYWINN